jgi:hypothetical protein
LPPARGEDCPNRGVAESVVDVSETRLIVASQVPDLVEGVVTVLHPQSPAG